jgi:hypothetical protein
MPYRRRQGLPRRREPSAAGAAGSRRLGVGDLEPTAKLSGITVTIMLDRKPLASLIKGGFDGTYDDGPAEVEAATRCDAGTHRL